LTVTSSPITLYTGRTNTVTIHIGEIRIGNFPLYSNFSPAFATPLLSGYSYTLTISLKRALARFINLELAPIAPRTGSPFQNGMRYSYNDLFTSTVADLQPSAKNAATQGTYTIDRGGNTPVTAIHLIATYSVPGDYHFRVKLGTDVDSIVYSAWGRLPAIPVGQSTGTHTISLTPFRKDADGNELDANGNIASDTGSLPALDVWHNGVQEDALPVTMPKGKRSDIIRFYTSTDDPGGSPTGQLEVPIWFGYRTMKVVSWGSYEDYTMNGPTGQGHRLINNDNNFGYNGITAVGGFVLTQVTTANFSNDAAGNSGFVNMIKNADVLLIQYPYYPVNDSQRTNLTRFMKKGGAVMFNCEYDIPMYSVLSNIYSPKTFSTTGTTQHMSGTETTNPNSKILNGPFNQFLPSGETLVAVGEDNVGRSFPITELTNNIGEDLEIIAKRSATEVFVFFDESRALLVTGDGGFLSSRDATGHGPLVVNADDRPTSKVYDTDNKYPSTLATNKVYNAFIFCNYLDFAVKYAAEKRDHAHDDSEWVP
jgi:hypothetical protein